MMELILICILFGTFMLLAYTLGLKNGYKLSNKEEITIPNINPITIVKEYQEDKKAKKEVQEFNTILENIEAYDGTGFGQKDV